MASRTDLQFLDPTFAREILPGGQYRLFEMDCPQEVMAAYERLWATKGRSGRAQEDGQLLVTWVVAQSLVKGDFDLASRLRIALESLGWQPSAD